MTRTTQVLLLVLFASAAGAAPRQASLTVDTGKVVGQVDEKVYGQFLEHIYHSVNGGLWGELVWSRSFEDSQPASGLFAVGEQLVAPDPTANSAFGFGDPAWRDYEITFEASRVAGDEGLFVVFRDSRAGQYALRLGVERNTRWRLERHAEVNRVRTDWVQPEPLPTRGLEPGRWYAVRVRVAGARVQAWVDGQSVVDYTDPTPLTAGRVVLGTRKCAAQFRAVRVTALDGTVLHSGLPRGLAEMGVAPQWHAYGRGNFEWVKDGAFNGDYCQSLAPQDGEAGVQQAPLRIDAGEIYHGSVWVRGDETARLVVRLVANGQTLAQADLGRAGGAQWQGKVFALRPKVSAAHATLQLGAAGTGRVWLDQASLMSGAARRGGGYRPDLLAAVDGLKPPVIRWPGGSFASGYRWKSGIGSQERRFKYPRTMWDDQDVNSYGTDEFVAMCRRLGSEPLIVLNVGSWVKPDERRPYLQDALDWLEYCNGAADTTWGGIRAANGHPEPYHIQYWELDNEIWRLAPREYVEIVKQWAPALRRVDPSIKLIACGSGQLGGRWADGDLAVIDQVADLVDYLSIHHYEKPERFADGIAAAEAFWATLSKRIAGSRNPRLKLYVSEWNAQSTDWRTGLYAGGILNAFERCEAVGLAGPALFLRHTSATAWDNAFINFDHTGWFAAPNYVVMQLWRRHWAPHRVACSGEPAGLNVVATRAADGRSACLKLVNPTDEAIDLELTVRGPVLPATARLEMVAPDSLNARNTLAAPQVVKVQTRTLEPELNVVRVSLPRWSAGVLSFQ